VEEPGDEDCDAAAYGYQGYDDGDDDVNDVEDREAAAHAEKLGYEDDDGCIDPAHQDWDHDDCGDEGWDAAQSDDQDYQDAGHGEIDDDHHGSNEDQGWDADEYDDEAGDQAYWDDDGAGNQSYDGADWDDGVEEIDNLGFGDDGWDEAADGDLGPGMYTGAAGGADEGNRNDVKGWHGPLPRQPLPKAEGTSVKAESSGAGCSAAHDENERLAVISTAAAQHAMAEDAAHTPVKQQNDPAHGAVVDLAGTSAQLRAAGLRSDYQRGVAAERAVPHNDAAHAASCAGAQPMRHKRGSRAGKHARAGRKDSNSHAGKQAPGHAAHSMGYGKRAAEGQEQRAPSAGKRARSRHKVCQAPDKGRPAHDQTARSVHSGKRSQAEQPLPAACAVTPRQGSSAQRGRRAGKRARQDQSSRCAAEAHACGSTGRGWCRGRRCWGSVATANGSSNDA
jgi:hypothetical protein